MVAARQPVSVPTLEQFSDLIGAIYDCAVDPTRWPETMRLICEQLACFHGAIYVLDFTGAGSDVKVAYPKLPTSWRNNPQLYEQVHALYRSVPVADEQPLDEPFIVSRELGEEGFRATELYRNWAAPLGICDAVQTIVMREPHRLGIFNATRHESVGVATTRETEILRLLAPHVRRAIAIGDLLNMKAIEAQTLKSTLDNFTVGVAIVTEGGRILHANQAARGMLTEGGPLRAVNGNLAGANRRATAELQRAIELAQTDEVQIGATGIGVALPGAEGEIATAHVLPLARGEARPRLMPSATAAVFVARADPQRAIELAAMAQAFRLTPAETRVLAQLARGSTLAEAAEALDISGTTARTHLTRLFAKTGVSRQADLLALVARLVPPVERPAGLQKS